MGDRREAADEHAPRRRPRSAVRAASRACRRRGAAPRHAAATSGRLGVGHRQRTARALDRVGAREHPPRPERRAPHKSDRASARRLASGRSVGARRYARRRCPPIPRSRSSTRPRRRPTPPSATARSPHAPLELLPRDGRVLDLGCASGGLLALLRSRASHLAGLELSETRGEGRRRGRRPRRAGRARGSRPAVRGRLLRPRRPRRRARASRRPAGRAAPRRRLGQARRGDPRQRAERRALAGAR